MAKAFVLRFIRSFPKGSIWQTRYVCFPLTLIVSTLALSHSHLSYWQRGIWFFLGLVTWTFLEYVLHRWVLHFRANGEIGRAMVDRLHAIHHADPGDKSQVCVPSLVAVPLWGVLLVIFLLCGGGFQASLLVTCGIALMMVVYDIAHYSAHYMPATNSLLKFLKTNHLSHHFENGATRFGVTTPVWDYLFGTRGN